jgi:hypothetical protein
MKATNLTIIFLNMNYHFSFTAILHYQGTHQTLLIHKLSIVSSDTHNLELSTANEKLISNIKFQYENAFYLPKCLNKIIST